MLSKPLPPAHVAPLEVRLDEEFLRREQLIEPLEGDPRGAADVVHADGLDATGVEELLRGVQRLFPGGGESLFAGGCAVHAGLLLDVRTNVLYVSGRE